MAMTARITKKVIEVMVRNLIADGYLSEDPIEQIYLIHGTVFKFKDGTICHGPRQALAYLNELVRKAEES